MNIIAALLLPTILGCLTVLLLLKDDSQPSLLEIISYGYPIGIGLTTYQMFLLGMFRVPLSLTNITIPIIIEIGIVAFCVYLTKPQRAFFPDITTASGFRTRKYAIYFAEITAVLWIMSKIGTIFFTAYLRPIQAWDSWANWSARAKVFYYSKSLLLDSPLSDVLGKGVIDVNSNYPPLNAMAQVWMALWVGSFDEVLVKFWTPLFLLSATLHLAIISIRELNRLFSSLIIIIFLSSPLLALHATETYSDLALAVYMLFALSSLLQVIRGKSHYSILVGIFSTMAMFTKDEGWFIAIPILLSCTFYFWKKSDRNTNFMRNVAICCVPCLFILPWLFCKTYYKLGMGADYLQLSFTFNPDVIYSYVKCMVSLMNFNIIFIFIPVLYLLNNKNNSTINYLAFPVAIYAIFFVSLYGFVTVFSQSLMFETAIFRNSLTYYPSCFLLAILLIKGIWRPACTSEKAVYP